MDSRLAWRRQLAPEARLGRGAAGWGARRVRAGQPEGGVDQVVPAVPGWAERPGLSCSAGYVRL